MVRWNAVEFLVGTMGPDVNPSGFALIEALKDDLIRDKASEALLKITGKN